MRKPELQTLATTVDDVEVTFEFAPRDRPRWVSGNGRGRGYMSNTYVDYNKKPRIYPSFDESILENLANRTTRDTTVMGRLLRKAMVQLELDGKVGWYAKAGCAMCPCSPGWVWGDAPLRSFKDDNTSTRYDVWVTFKGLDPNRHDDAAKAEQAGRLGSVLADPTLPFGKQLVDA